MAGRQAGAGGIDRLGVPVRPYAQRLQALYLFRGNRAVGHRADVEQQVAAHADALGEHPDDLAYGFVVRVPGLPAPAVVHGDAELPRAGRRRDRDALLGGGIVALVAEARVYHRLRRPRIEHLARGRKIPPFPPRGPVAVEPEQVGLKLLAQLLELPALERQKALPAPSAGPSGHIRLALLVTPGAPGA
jgi:hypothetical protein